MHKNKGRQQQVRGNKRHQKVLNRKLNRNPSDLSKVADSYSNWLGEKIKADADKIAEKMNENA